MLDFEVMFDNARYYNEEDSQVYQVDICLSMDIALFFKVLKFYNVNFITYSR